MDDYNKLHSEWTKGKQDAADAAWVIKQREADSQAKLVGDTAVDDEYIRLDGIRQTNITAAENSAVANARTAAEDQAWTTRQETLGQDRKDAQDLAVANARTAAEDQAWTTRQETLDKDRTDAQDLAVANARTAVEDRLDYTSGDSVKIVRMHKIWQFLLLAQLLKIKPGLHVRRL